LLQTRRNSVKGDDWSEALAHRAAEDAAVQFGIADRGDELELLKWGTNANFRFGAGLLRVARPEVPAGLPAREVAVSEELGRLGVPAVAAIEAAPAVTHGCQVTLWRWEEHLAIDPPGRARELGSLLRTLHSAGRPNLDLPRWDGLELIARHLGVVESTGRLDPGDLRLLTTRRDELASRWGTVTSAEEEVAVHGDLHFGNVLLSPRGLLLADLETFSLGPPEVDLVPVMVSVRRFGMSPQVLDDFLAGYGWTPGTEDRERLGVACEIRALLTTTWLASVSPDHPDLAVRLEYWRDGVTAAPWQAS